MPKIHSKRPNVEPRSSGSLANTLKREGSARGVMAIIVGNGHDDTSSNPGLD